MLISNPTHVAKLFFVITFSGLIMYVILAVYSFRSANQSDNREDLQSKHKWKYILIDTKESAEEFPEGTQLFMDNKCPHFHCYITTNKKRLKRKEDFDAVVVNVTDLAHIKLPAKRPKKQRYVFYGREPSDRTPVCSPDADNYFNYTWSYKLSSDIVSPFFAVLDKDGMVVAPSLNATWTASSGQQGQTTTSKKEHLVLDKRGKAKAVAFILRSCKDKDGRIFANRLRVALKFYSQELNFFGCGKRFPLKNVDTVIAKRYYFVLVSTSSLAEDYVTDKIFRAYWNNAVPIIKAKADLHKFLPLGSYVNAHLQSPDQIAALVHYSINNPNVYRKFFNWRNYYTIQKRGPWEGICQLCSLLMTDDKSYSNSSANLREWWESSSGNKLKCAKGKIPTVPRIEV